MGPRRGRAPARRAITLWALLLLASGFIALNAQSGSERELRVFSPQTSYVVPVFEHNGTPYAGLLELLEPLGRVESRIEKGRWKMTFAAPRSRSVEVEFTEGSNKGKVRGSNYELPAEFVLLRGRGLVPLGSLGGLLARVMAQSVQVYPGERVLIGVTGFSFSQQLRQGPSRLVLSFPSPVNPTIATEAGRIRLSFVREPLIPPATGREQKFSDALFQSSSIASLNGVLQLTVNVTQPVMATFSDSGKTITIVPSPAPQMAEKSSPETNSGTSTTPPSTPATAGTAGAATSIPTPAPTPPRPVVVIDAAHGGSDHGAALPANASEKELTLEVARLIQHDLQSRGLGTLMLRTGDTTLSADQRAASANSARILAYISVHATGDGHGVRLYTALLSASSRAPTHKQFLPWDTAQASWLDLSGNLAGSIAAELTQRQLEVHATASPLRPLNNIWAPAIAIEIAPQQAGKAINTGNYLRTIAASVSAGVAAMSSKLEAAR